MTEKREQQGTDRDTVSTEVGVVHVMPKAYQGGILPAGSHAREPKAPPKREVKPPVKKKAPSPPPQVKRPPKKPTPVKNPHKKRVLFIVLGSVALVLLIVVLILLFAGRSVEPEPITPPVTVSEPVQNLPDPEEPEAPEEPPADDVPVFLPEPVPGRDTDSDGLSDVEERLYGSNLRLPDTDRDGFLDGNEVFHQYDPLTPDPATLLDREIVRRISGGGVSFLAPTLWQSSGAQEPPRIEITLEVPGGERVLVQTDPVLQRTLEAFVEARGGADMEYSLSKTGYPLATSKDQMVAYVALDTQFVTLTYLLGERTSIDFIQTFQMIANSVDVAEEL